MKNDFTKQTGKMNSFCSLKSSFKKIRIKNFSSFASAGNILQNHFE